MIIKGAKYLLTTNSEFSVIARFIPIKSILQDEEKCTLWPWSLTYYNPEEFNPYGGSVMDLTEDKQRALSKLVNLGLSRAIRSSLGGTRVYDKSKITNRSALANLTEDPKLIGVNLAQGEQLGNVIQEVPMSQIPQDNFSMSDALNYYTRVATGMDPMTM